MVHQSMHTVQLQYNAFIFNNCLSWSEQNFTGHQVHTHSHPPCHTDKRRRYSGFPVRSVNVLPLPVWVSSGCSSFLHTHPQKHADQVEQLVQTAHSCECKWLFVSLLGWDSLHFSSWVSWDWLQLPRISSIDNVCMFMTAHHASTKGVTGEFYVTYGSLW